MSSHAALVMVSSTLKEVLEEALGQAGLGQVTVVLEDPSQQPPNANANKLSIWLYQVLPDEHLRNLPPAPANRREERPSALALNLYYLLTPLTSSRELDQRILGVAMLGLHQNAIISLTDRAERVNEEIRIGLVTDTLEDRSRLWDSLQRPYRLSTCYIVRTVRLEGSLRRQGGRVDEVNSEMQKHEDLGTGVIEA